MKRRRCRHEDGLRPDEAKSPPFLPFSRFHFFISATALQLPASSFLHYAPCTCSASAGDFIEKSTLSRAFFWRARGDSSPAGEPARGSDAPPARHSFPLASNPPVLCILPERKTALRTVFLSGAPGGIRTHDLPVRSRALYPLSYGRTYSIHRGFPRQSVILPQFSLFVNSGGNFF